jgi:hypothetical protein
MPRASALVAATIVATRPPGQEVERLDHQIVDAAGRIGQPWRALNTLDRMLRAGSISPAMRKSGEIFHKQFREAALDPLRAADPTRIPVLATAGNRAWRRAPGCAAAYRQVMLALDMLGGLQLPGGSCAWHVLGCEWTLDEWSRSRVWANRRVDVRNAAGILLVDLGLLQRHYQVA